MKAYSLSKILFVTVMMLGAVSVRAAWFTTNTTLNTGDTTYDNQDIVVSNCTLTANGPHGFNSLQVLGGGVVTHSPATTNQIYALQLTIANSLLIDKSSKIDVSGRGYPQGRTVGNTRTAGATGRSGGSYGGLGIPYAGTANASYGDYRDPQEPGSGGGLDYSSGAGGGLVRITAGSAQLDGAILANGASIVGYYGGGGSGGGIVLKVGTLSGSGLVAASGGDSSYDGGGGGGRVAIHYTALSGFNAASQAQAHGGIGQGAGSVGTVYLKPAGALGQLLLANHGSPAGLWTPLGNPADTVFEADHLILAGKPVLAATAGGAPIHADAVSVLEGAVLTHLLTTPDQVYTLQMAVTNALKIDADSKIDVSGRGYPQGRTVGNTRTAGATGRSGGSYGGLGIPYAGTANASYGDYRDPQEPGSGGGLDYSSGAGGGLVQITAGSAQLDGAILANGASIVGSYGGGGSGGGIVLNVGTLSGSGLVAASGGDSSYDGGGGGGRVAIHYTALSGFNAASQAQAHGGIGQGAGSVGTVYLQPAGGPAELRLVNHGALAGLWTPLGNPGDKVFSVDRLVVVGTNVVVAAVNGAPIDAHAVSLLEGAALTHPVTTAAQAFALRLTVRDELTIDATSKIDVSGRGYPQGRTLGNTTTGGATGESGGSYGGLGFPAPWYERSNGTYGDYRDPQEPGSGGGSSYSSGAGGGLIRITADSARVDGEILANGASIVGSYGGGGSGGGIVLNVGTLSGSGLVAASGGSSSYNGGGSGGRVAIYYTTLNGFDATTQAAAHGGSGGQGSGAVGTVYLKPAGTAGELRLANHGSPVGMWTPLGSSTDTVFQAESVVLSGAGMVVATVSGAPVQAHSISVLNGAVLTHPVTTASETHALRLNLSGKLLVDATSKIDVSGRGYGQGRTTGNTVTNGATGESGGAYGGLGGYWDGAPNAVYGDYRDPQEPGSGGGSSYSSGAGGGLIRITADSAQVDGEILANGVSVVGNYGGGGSGGGILLKVGELSGQGGVAANGGSSSYQGGGGGGRVALYYKACDGFDQTAQVTAHAGPGGAGTGAVGTVYLKQDDVAGLLLLSSHGGPAGVWTPLGVAADREYRVEELVVSGTNVVVAPEHEMAIQAQAISLLSGAVMTHRTTTADQVYSLRMIIVSNLLIDASARIDVSGRGYLQGRTAGNTRTDGATGESGGSYGGLGAAWDGLPNPVYGDEHNPQESGSGGGSSYSSGAGGGLVRITAGGVQVDGAILANGVSVVGNYGGGGSGGGILLNVGALQGIGQVAAAGGRSSYQGGGGGGRVAIYSWSGTSMPATNLTAKGGAGGTGGGQTGSVYIGTAPFFGWQEQASLLHGSTTIAWYAFGVDPTTIGTEISAFCAGNAYPIAAGMKAIDSAGWDTTTVPDGAYELRAVFRNASAQVVGDISREVLVNNSATWHTGTITGQEVWAPGTTHIVEGSLTIATNGQVTIQPGTVVKFAPEARMTVKTGGTLIASGTEGAKVAFTALADDTLGGDTNMDGDRSRPQPGTWNGVNTETGAVFASNDQTVFRYLRLVHSGTIASDETWLGSYLHQITGDIVVPSGVTLTIQPGAVAKFSVGLGMTIQSGGSLIAPGTVAQPIRFTSIQDDTVGGDSNGDGSSTVPGAGDWRGILVSGGTAVLDHVELLYGGRTPGGNWDTTSAPMAVNNNGTVTISNSVIRDAFFDGIINWGSGNITATSTLIADCDRGLDPDGSSVTRLINCTLDNNRIGIWGHNGTVQITNTIISHSLEVGIYNILNSPITMRSSDVWSSKGVNYQGNISNQTGQNGNLSVDPKFKNAAQGNYRLNFGSPCIDAADATVAPATDFMGAPRYDDPRSANTGVAGAGNVFADMGAYEFVETAASDIDLVAVEVTGPTQATAGGTATLSWKIRNIGSGSVTGAWHNAILLLPGNPNSLAEPLEAGESLITANLGPGQDASFTAQVRIPGGTEGAWRWAVKVNNRGEVFEGINWTNNLGSAAATVELQVPELGVGATPLVSQINRTDEPQWFKVRPAADQDVLITLHNAVGSDALDLYLGYNYMPTRQNYDVRQEAAGSVDANALAAGGVQTCYILVYARALPVGTANFTLSAKALDFSLTSIISTSQVGNNGPATFRVLGGKLRDGLVYQLVAAIGDPIVAKSVYIVNSSEAYLTFDLTGKTLGSYSLVAIESGHRVTLANAVTVQTGKPGRIEVSATSPANIRPYREGKVVITYRNTGDSDAPAPLMVLDALNATLASPTCQVYAGNHMLLLGINNEGPAGVLPPGAGGTLTVSFLSQTGGECVFDVRLAESPSDPMVWGDLKTGMMPYFINANAWDIIWNNILSEAGSTIGEFNALLANRATTLSQMGIRMYEVRNLLAYIAQQADQFGALSRRFIIGGYGRGWADTTDISLETDTGGNLIMKVAGKAVRVFRVYGKYYIPLPGDTGMLIKQSDHFEIREASGSTLVFRSDGHIDYTENVNHQRMTFGYTQSRVTSLTTHNGDEVKIDYNAQGRVSQVTDAVGRVTRYEYDGSDYLTKITAFDGTITTYTYNTATGAQQHSLASVVLPGGKQYSLSYDARGALTKLSRGNGAEPVTLSTNGMGGVNLGYADGGSLSFAWDQYGQIRKMIDPVGNITRFMFDGVGNWIEAISAEGNRVTMEYDYAANQTAHINAAGQRLDVGFDPSLSLPKTFRSVRGNETQFGYDTNNNLQKIVYPDGNSEDYNYNNLSRVTQFRNARGQVSHYSYDVRGTILAKEYPNGDKVDYSYDAHQNPVSVIQTIGGKKNETRYEYSAQDRITKVTYPNGRSLSFTYDVAGRRTQLTSSDGFTQKNSYDANGRLTALLDGNGNTMASYTYDAVGHLSQKQLMNGVSTSFEYNSQDQVVRLINKKGDAILSRFDYTYDSMGRKTRSVGPTGTNDYAYDAMGQLTGMTSSTGKHLDYSYDPDGNRLTAVDGGQATAYVANSMDQITEAGSMRHQWDADGNLVFKTDGVSQWSYLYDPESRLTKASTPQGIFEYEYDAAGNVSAVSKDGNRTEYLLDPTDPAKVVAEIGSSSSVFYIHGIGLAGRANGAQGERQFYSFDGNGNTSELVDSNGQVLNSYSYLPFGEVQSATGSTANPYRFGGLFGFRDNGSGLVQTGVRQYDPQLGRYITRDPAYIPIGNVYMYAANDPVNYTDRSGKVPECFGSLPDVMVSEETEENVGNMNTVVGTTMTVTDMAYGYQRAQLLGKLQNAIAFNNSAQRAALTATLSQQSQRFMKPMENLGKAGKWLGPAGTMVSAYGAYNTYQDYKTGKADGDKMTHDSAMVAGSLLGFVPVYGPALSLAVTLVDEGSKRSGWMFEWYYGESFRQEEEMAKRLKARKAGSRTRIVTSSDPNDITGPSGYGSQSYIMVGMTMNYLIQYENKSNALASAQMVFVTNKLAKTLDYSTFELGNMGFGTNTVVVPKGRQNYTTRVDATRTLGLLVNINVEFDPTNGIVLWTFMSVDPVTGDLPEDPLAGFLPPNTNAPAGEGWVRYSIRPRTNSTDGSLIPAMASIVFDDNTRIDTPAITNALDSVTPASQVNSLPATSPRTFTVGWTGQDGLGAGIAYYSLFVSTNQEPFGAWLNNTTNTSALFSGVIGNTYAFYSLATDGVGYWEQPPSGPDASTKVEDQAPATKASVQVGPNMNIARMGHFIKELPDGRVVVFGGRGTGFVSLKSIEIWDPATNGFSLISAPYSFDFGALVRLADGRYLMAGGAADLGVAPGYNTAQIFDPNNNSVTSTGTTMTKRRTMCRGALLTNGKVLIAGGWYDNSSTTYGEIYDPASQAFTATGPLRTPRASPLVLPTADGRAVIAGGMGVYGTPSFLETVEIYDPAQNTFAVLSTNLFVGEAGWALRTDLDRPIEDFQTSDGGYVFLASRTTNSITEVALAIFDPATRQFTKRALQPTFTEKVGFWPAVVASGDNAAYFVSGYNTNGGANLFFRVQRVDLATGERTTSDELSITNYYPGSTAMTLLKDGRLFVTGGTTRVDSQYNFQPVKNTFMVSGLPGNAAQPTTASLEISYLPSSSIQISWPTSMVHYVLQSISGFNASPSWRTVTDPPSVVGDRFVLTLSSLDATHYYRLYALPQLSIQPTNSLLMLSWPKSATDFRLQMAVDLLPATQWQPVSDVPLTDNNRNVLIVTPVTPSRYYRLVSP